MIDSEFQKKVLACMFRITKFNLIACQHLKASYFEKRVHQNIAKSFIDYHSKYGVCISSYAFAEVIKKQFKGDKAEIMGHIEAFAEIAKISVADSDFILDQLIDFIKLRRWKILIEDAVSKHLSDTRRTPNIKAIEQEAIKIANISKINRSEGYEYFDPDNIKERATARNEALTMRPGISSGIPELDLRMHGSGWMGKELYLIIAPPKRGKTMFLLWAANTAAKKGKKAVYFTCEVSQNISCDRLDACNTNISFSDLPRRDEDFINAMESEHIKGRLKIYEYPTKTLTVHQIEEHLKDLERQGFKPDIVLVDYLDLLRPTLKDNDDLKRQADIAVRLRGTASKFEIPVITASQINRSGKNKSVNDGGDIAGSFDKVAVADQVIALSATDDELANKELKIVLAESRNNPSGVIKIKTAFHMGRLYEKTIGVDE